MRYFAYGLNLNKESMKARCPNAVQLMQYKLHDWQLEFSGAATIVQQHGGQVEGGLWDITPKCERALDELEGFPFHYLKHEHNGVMFYAKPQDARSRLRLSAPWGGYLESVLKGLRDFGYACPARTLISNMGKNPSYELQGYPQTPLTLSPLLVQRFVQWIDEYYETLLAERKNDGIQIPL